MPNDANALDVLRARGFVADVTEEDALRKLLDTEQVTFYVGFDPTAPSLHVGHLVGMMAMAWLQRLGHRPVAVAGGATGRIGDPSGRDAERELLDEDALAGNLAGIRAQLSRVLDLRGAGDRQPDAAHARQGTAGPAGLLVDNHDWLGRFSFLDFLRDVGKHFSVNSMIARESVRRRLETREQGLSFTEFSYQLLQAYDFAHLYAAEGCRLQGGGSDQWGNIVAGVELTRRLHGGEVYGLVWPLLTRSDGRKFSKSSGEAVWLDAAMTSPYAFYQWFYNLPDEDAGRFLPLFTFLDLEEIDRVVAAHEADPAGREAQRTLATEITRIVHGEDGVAQAQRASRILFGSERFADLDDATLAGAFDAAPSVELPRGRLQQGIGLLELMVEAGAASSNGEARRTVQQGGVSLNNVRVEDARRVLGPADLASASMLVLRVGKKRHYLVRFC